MFASEQCNVEQIIGKNDKQRIDFEFFLDEVFKVVYERTKS